MLREEVLHHGEGAVTVPVAVLHADDLDAAALDGLAEGLDALVVDGGRDAAQDDDFAAARHPLAEEFARVAAEAGIVAGDVEVLDALFGKAAIDDGDPLAGLCHALDRAGERRRFEGQHDERVDVARRHHVLDVADLLAGIARCREDELQLRIGLLKALHRLLRMIVHATGPAVRSRRDGYADDLAVLSLRRSRRGKRRCQGQRLESLDHSHRASPSLHTALLPGICAALQSAFF